MQTLLAGPADEATLRDVFARIAERNTAFCMACSDGVSERIFYFAIGGVRVIASGARMSLSVGEDFVARGLLTRAQLDELTESVGGDARLVADAAVRSRLVTAEAFQESVERQVQEDLLDLFFWDGAEVSLVEGQPPKDFYQDKFQTAALTCDVGETLRTVLDRVDAWRETVPRLPSGRDVFETADRAAEDLRGPFAALLSYVDGQHTASDAIEKSGARRVAAFEFLMFALADGRIRKTVGSAAQRVTRDQLLRDVAQLEDALRHRVDGTVVRRRLARTLEALGETARAARQWRELGDHFRRENDTDAALQCYSDCIRVLPTDFAAREVILEIHRHRKEYAQVVSHGRLLADLFFKHNLLNRAKHLLVELVGLEPADVALRRLLILVLIGLGERDLALRHLHELARILEQRGATPGEMRDVYVRILALDPRDAAARSRLDQITGVAFQRRVFRGTAAATAAVVIALGAWAWTETQARIDVNQAIAEAQILLASRNVDGARQRLLATLGEHRMSHASRSAQAFLAQIELVQREQAEHAARRKASASGVARTEAALRREQSESAAADMVREAARLSSEGRYRDAHRIATDVLSAHGGTRAAAGVRLPLAIRAAPADARIVFNGKEIGVGTAVLEYSPSSPGMLEVTREGFDTRRVPLDGPQPPEMVVGLHRPVRWTASFEAPVDASPLVHEGVVYVAGRDCFLTAISAADGSRLWRTPLGLYGDAAVPPVIAGGRIVVATASGEAVALNAGDGAVAWRASLPAAVERAAAVSGAAVVFATSDGSVAALAAATGEAIWRLPAKSVATGAPVVSGAAELEWVSARGTLVAYSADTGRPSARAPVTAVLRGTPVRTTEDRVWAFAEDETLRLVSAATGSSVKRFPVPRAYLDVQPAVEGETAYVASHDGTVAALTTSGDVAFRKRLAQPSPAGVTVSKGRIYAGGAGGSLSVLDARTGDELWRYDAGAPVSARPLVADGSVYVTTAEGLLVALLE